MLLPSCNEKCASICCAQKVLCLNFRSYCVPFTAQTNWYNRSCKTTFCVAVPLCVFCVCVCLVYYIHMKTSLLFLLLCYTSIFCISDLRSSWNRDICLKLTSTFFFLFFLSSNRIKNETKNRTKNPPTNTIPNYRIRFTDISTHELPTTKTHQIDTRNTMCIKILCPFGLSLPATVTEKQNQIRIDQNQFKTKFKS